MLPSCLARCSRVATTFALEHYMSLPPPYRNTTEPYEFGRYHVELCYGLIHDGELGPNNLGPRLAIRGK